MVPDGSDKLRPEGLDPRPPHHVGKRGDLVADGADRAPPLAAAREEEGGVERSGGAISFVHSIAT